MGVFFWNGVIEKMGSKWRKEGLVANFGGGFAYNEGRVV